MIQLANSLHNVGQADAAVELLDVEPATAVTGDAAWASLALARRDAGSPDEALLVALAALVQRLPLYQRALTQDARELATGISCGAAKQRRQRGLQRTARAVRGRGYTFAWRRELSEHAPS